MWWRLRLVDSVGSFSPIYLRLWIFMKSAVIGIILSPIGQLTIVHIIFSSAVSFNDANDDEQEDKKCEREYHSNKPSSSCYAVVSLRHHHNIYKQITLTSERVSTLWLTTARSIEMFRSTGSLKVSVDWYNAELVFLVWVESAYFNVIFGSLIWSSQESLLANSTILHIEMRPGCSRKVRMPGDFRFS